MATYLLFQVVRTPFYNTSGVQLSGGRIDTFAAGTSTPIATYSDNTGTSYGTSITLDSTGRTPYGWYGDQDTAYKIRVYNSSGTEQTQYQQDNITFPERLTSFDTVHLERATITTTGTSNNYDVDAVATSPDVEVSYLEWDGAAPWTVTGISARDGDIPADGRLLIVQNTATAAGNYIWFKSQNTGSTADFRFVTESANGQYIGAGGSLQMIYSALESRWYVTVLDPGQLISPVFNGADFTGAQWTVIGANVLQRGFRQRGRSLEVYIEVNGAQVAGVATPDLNQTIPGGFTATETYDSPNFTSQAGAISVGRFQSSNTLISAELVDGANWTVAAIVIVRGNFTWYVD